MEEGGGPLLSLLETLQQKPYFRTPLVGVSVPQRLVTLTVNHTAHGVFKSAPEVEP